jgi:hypothetical protein
MRIASLSLRALPALAAACAIAACATDESSGAPSASLSPIATSAQAIHAPAAALPPTAQIPGRAAVFAFAAGRGDGTDAPQIRRWLNHGPNELAELTGPNDRQFVGDFGGVGHDQVLLLNYDCTLVGKVRQTVLIDLIPGGPLGTPPRNMASRACGADTLLDGLNDEDDLSITGDFLKAGHDQVLLIDRVDAKLKRAALLEHTGTKPTLTPTSTFDAYAESGLFDDDDLALAGDFLHRGYDQVLLFNQSMHPGQTRLVIFDLHDPSKPNYSQSYAQAVVLDAWNDQADRRYVGDFMGLGYDQVLFLNIQNGNGRVRILDFNNGSGSPIVRYSEDIPESVLLNGWYDDIDWAFAGDFTASGHAQMLFMNRYPVDGRVMVLDFSAGKPAQIKYRESWGHSPVLNGWEDDDDVVLVGRFTGDKGAALLSFNNGVVGQRIDEKIASNADELGSILRSHFTGRVLVPPPNPRDHRTSPKAPLCPPGGWDMTDNVNLPVRKGVEVKGQRGEKGSRPVLCTGPLGWYNLFSVTGSDARVEGLHLRGPATDGVRTGEAGEAAIAVTQDPIRERGRRIVIADNELDHWSEAGVVVDDGLRARPELLESLPTNPTPDETARAATLESDFHPGRPRLHWDDAHLARIERNFIHDNARNGAGYGVVTGYSVIEGNVFDYNRHAVSSGGGPFTGYNAHYNYVLQGGFMEGGYYNQHFDVHGTGDHDYDGMVDSWGHWYGGFAGEHVDIGFNTIRGEQEYYAGTAVRPAFMLRGKAQIGAYFHENVVAHDTFGAAISLKMYDGSLTWKNHFLTNKDFNFDNSPDNIYDTDHANDIATGDFDGDGYSDVFIATGTAWFYSSGGQSEWRFLQSTYLTTGRLAFADMDGDGKTDPIWRNSEGWLEYASGGVGSPVAFAPASPSNGVGNLPGSATDLRFFDMNGDGKTDIFCATGTRWYVWDGATHAWSNTTGYAQAMGDLRFGRFDDSAGVDVIAMVNGKLNVSSGGRALWATVPGSPVASLTGTVVGDFDDDDRYDDIVSGDDKKWWYSSGGRGAWTLLRTDDSDWMNLGNMKLVVWGDFDKNGRLDALRTASSWQTVTNPNGTTRVVEYELRKFRAWLGLGAGPRFTEWSTNEMR